MLDQLLNIVKQYSREAVVNNPEVPNEQNNEVMAEATKTIAHGFQNVMAGGGLQNILDLFKGNNNNTTTGSAQQSGIGGLLRNPIVTMMIGYFISKLVSRYKMSPSAASNIANTVIPNSLNGLIQKTRDPNENQFTLDNLVNSLTGREDNVNQGNGSLQDILERFAGGGNGGENGYDLQDINNSVTQRAQRGMETREQAGGGIMDMLKGLLSR